MRSRLITVACLGVAVICYSVGFALPGMLFIAAGVIAELAFWVRLLRRRRRD
jgi:hypothetical protein